MLMGVSQQTDCCRWGVEGLRGCHTGRQGAGMYGMQGRQDAPRHYSSGQGRARRLHEGDCVARTWMVVIHSCISACPLACSSNMGERPAPAWLPSALLTVKACCLLGSSQPCTIVQFMTLSWRDGARPSCLACGGHAVQSGRVLLAQTWCWSCALCVGNMVMHADNAVGGSEGADDLRRTYMGRSTHAGMLSPFFSFQVKQHC